MNVEFGAILLLVVAGFLPHLLIPRLRFKLPASGTLALSASIAVFGLLAFLAAALVEDHLAGLKAADQDIADWLARYLETGGDKPRLPPAGTFVLAIGLSLLGSLLFAGTQYLRAARRSWSLFPEDWTWVQKLGGLSAAIGAERSAPLNRMLTQAFLQQSLVMVSLSSRKVYIGILIRLSSPSELEQGKGSLGLVPVLSGYRDSATLELRISNDYQERLQALRDAVEEGDEAALAALSAVGIHFPVSEVETASLFDSLVWESFVPDLEQG